MKNLLRVDRIKELYDPFSALDICYLDTYEKINWDQYKPEEKYRTPDNRDNLYHFRRIVYFADLYQRNSPVEPVEIIDYGPQFRKNVTSGILVFEGHHRLCAAILSNVPKVWAYYSGRMDILRYLQGRRKTVPQE